MSEGFPVAGLADSPNSLKTLSDLSSRCRRFPETAKLWRQVVQRLELLHERVASLDAQSPIRAKFCRVLVQVTSQLRRKPLLLRLAGSEAIVATIRELQLKISDVAQSLHLDQQPELLAWEQQWDDDRAEQFAKLRQLVADTSERMLANEFRGDKKVKEALMTLHSGASWKGQAQEMLALKQQTFERVLRYSNQEGLKMFSWFIPIDDVEFEDEAIGARGTFGDVCRGTWLHDGERTEVAVKRLFPETSSDSDDAFLRQLELWGRLPPHKHILQLYGGSHVTQPQFYVCENAHNGNLFDFLEQDNRSVLFWRLFRQVALGLQFLHSNKTVHGGLKCSNILVGANYTAKLADFGFSKVRSLSAGLSAHAEKADFKSVRWKPKEVLAETGMEAPLYASDIYSLAMCMIEAKTHEAPFGMSDDSEAMAMIMNGERHPRPEEVSDEDWAFISRLCNPDFAQRPSLDEVLKELTALAEEEKRQHPSIEETPAEPAGFPVTTLPGSPQSRQVLNSFRRRFSRKRECRIFFDGFIARLNAAHDAVAEHGHDQWRVKYCGLLKKFMKTLRRQPLLERLAGADTIAYTFQELNSKLDDICIGVGAATDAWKADWTRGRDHQAHELVGLVSATAPRMLIGEMRSEEAVATAMVEMFTALEENRPGPLADVMRETLGRLKVAMELETRVITSDTVASVEGQANILAIFRWFIPERDVEVKEGDIIGSASYGTVAHGTWRRRDGTVEDVVVKSLDDQSIGSETSFLRQLQLWYELPRHPNIIQLYGGCHLVKQPFFVCENAPGGSFVEFFSKAENQDMLWPMFLQVAEGLQVLHSHNIVHDGLKSANILIGANNTPKISDVALCLSNHMLTARDPYLDDRFPESVRWKPRERLVDMNNALPRFKSDVYSLGMCMIESKTLGVPFEMCDDDEVMEKIIRGEPYERPDHVSDDEWSVISRLIAVDIDDRPNIDEVILAIRKLSDLEQAGFPINNIVQRDTTTTYAKEREIEGEEKCADLIKKELSNLCTDCGVLHAFYEAFCRRCGFAMRDRNQPPSHEAILCYLQRPAHHYDRITHAWRKAFEAVLALQSLHERGIFHGNLKPTNIRIGNDGKAKLSGFQLSGAVDNLNAYRVRNLEGLRWQAPHVLAGSTPSLTTDLYSLGMCIITMVTSEPPWGMNMNDSEIKEIVLNSQQVPPRAAGFTDQQWELVTGMLSNEVMTIGDVVQGLQMYVNDSPAPEWAISQCDVVVTDDELSQSHFFSRRRGYLLGTRVAVEKLQAPFDSLQRSSQSFVDLWFRLRHPNIIQLFGAYEEANSLVFVCEDTAGGQLAASCKRLSPKMIWRNALGVAYALRYMHACGIVHGDVISQNIFVTSSGVAKLSGFALSCSLRKDVTECDDDRNWVSPSYDCGHRRTFASDVFSLGKLIIGAMAGQLNSWSRYELCDACNIIDNTQESSFTSAEWQLVADMCCCDSQARITMAEVVDRLARLVAIDEAIDNKSASFPEGSRQWQGIVLEKLLEAEKEDADREQRRADEDDEDDSETDSHSVSSEHRAEGMLVQHKALLHQQSVQTEARLTVQGLINENPKRTLDKQPVPSTTVSRMFNRETEDYTRFPHGLVVTRKLKRGGFGKVAHGMWFGAPVAVKWLMKMELDTLQDFRKELNIWNALRHPHIINLFGVSSPECYVFVSEFGTGGQMNSYVKDKKNYMRVWELLHDAALGLQWLHFHGIVHADLKCDNVVVAEDDRAKLIDFGLSRVTTCKGLLHSAAVPWQAPESLKKDVLTLASDVYSFGMCIIEALSGAYPWCETHNAVIPRKVKAGQLPSRPKCFTLIQWELVKRMCCLEPEKRLKIDDVVEVLGFFANRSPYADDKRLKDRLTTWVRVGASEAMREHEKMCLDVFDRLGQIHQACWDSKAAQNLPATESVRRKFNDIMSRFSTFLRNHTGLPVMDRPVYRLASTRLLDEKIACFHEDISELDEEVSNMFHAGPGDGLTKWRQQWKEDRRANMGKFKALVEGEYSDVLSKKVTLLDSRESLMMLKFEVDFRTAQYKTDDIAEEYYHLMQVTLDKMASLPGVKIAEIPDWFIPRYSVGLDAGSRLDCGSVHRTSWSEGASSEKSTKVVVKCVDINDKEAFCKETEVLSRLDHPHILKLYGACHVGSPTFFVCDDATHDSFQEYLKNDKSQLWRLFYEAALGLEFLYSENVVHGNLKCSNLLVGSDNKAKLCDFGFSNLRSRIVGSSIRWRAPEYPPSSQNKAPDCASDVYSLGMCIIEVFLGEPPYGTLDVETIKMKLKLLQPYPRPPTMTDDEWTLVEKLVHPVLTQRLSLSAAITSLKVFADQGMRESPGAVGTDVRKDTSTALVCGVSDASKFTASEAHNDVYPVCDENEQQNAVVNDNQEKLL